MIITFQNYIPQPRQDGEVWTQVRIEEAVDESGPWVDVETIALDPVDSDPTDPQPRSFTTEQATLADGYYRVVFIDQTGDESLPTESVRYGPTYADIPDISPSVDEVAALLRARTKNFGTFNTETKPTAAQVSLLVGIAAASVKGRINAPIPYEQAGFAKHVVTLETARMIEASYMPEQTATEYAIFTPLTTVLENMVPDLIAACRYPMPTALA